MWNWSENNDILENYPPYKNAPVLREGEAECHKNDIIFSCYKYCIKMIICVIITCPWNDNQKKIYPKALSLESINIL